jgi:hypothetical protein
LCQRCTADPADPELCCACARHLRVHRAPVTTLCGQENTAPVDSDATGAVSCDAICACPFSRLLCADSRRPGTGPRA